jgi:SAM-dependent methyltransferase
MFERGDAQVHPFLPGQFDLAISRFGTMFFADPVAAFTNISRALRAGGRLVMMVWQSRDRNEWATVLHHAATGGAVPVATGLNAFSLADPAALQSILDAAGFVEVGITDVCEPVYYGPDATAALDLVRDMKHFRDELARLDAAEAQRALARLRQTLAAHETAEGVLFDSRAWLVTARRAT